MKKVKIFLADLTHMGLGVATETMPLGIGLIASYAKKTFGESIEIKLFKYPDKFLKALKEDLPDIVGSSNYVWNSFLSEWACRKAKQIHPNVLTVQGGPNFPFDNVADQIDLLQNRPHTDIYVKLEGEVAFSKILEKFLSSGPQGVLTAPIPGCVYLDPKAPSSLVAGPDVPRLQDLDEIPSPYTNHLMDEFFDGILSPIIQTTRGCPFTCDFCNSAASYYNKIRVFSTETVFAEVDYIADRATAVENSTGRGSGMLSIGDDNFGMYPRDKEVSRHIAQKNTHLGWPRYMYAATGKNRVERVSDAISFLSKVLVQSFSLQSSNPETLEAIGRANMKLVSYAHLSKAASDKGLLPNCELIIPLPYETLQSYYEGIRNIIEIGNMKITTFTLQMNYGTVYRDKEFKRKHGYKEKYRLVPRDFGEYDGEKIFEPEMVASSTKYMSFEDYLDIRCFTFYVETFYDRMCEGFIKFVLEMGLSRYDYMATLRDEFKQAPESLKKVRESFINETIFELKDSEEALFEFYSKPENFEKLKKGLIGGNVVFKHKAMAVGDCVEDVVCFVAHCVKTLLLKSKHAEDLEFHEMLECIKRASYCKIKDVLSRNYSKDTYLYEGAFDVQQWSEDKKNRPLVYFKKPTKTFFSFTEPVRNFRNKVFDQYGDSISARTSILAKFTRIDRFFRTPLEKEVHAGPTLKRQTHQFS